MAASPPLRTVHLRCSSPGAAAVAVEGGGGVDLALVGRALGLDPATVRLNGYFLSRGPGHVSSGVTWRALLAFFAARGLPAGADAAAPVAVHGSPAPPRPLQDPTILMCSKRRYGLEHEQRSKKSKLRDNSSTLSKSGDELLSDDITFGFKRRLKLDESSPGRPANKKVKEIEYSSVNGAETQQPVKFSCSFVKGHLKRPREEDMTTSLSCKRVR